MLQAILADSFFWLPKQASTVAPSTDNLFNVILWICVFFFLLVTVLLVALVVKYRHRPGMEHDQSVGHSMTLEITWTIIPSIIVVFLYYYGFKQYMNLAVEPPNSYEVVATGRMWQWGFTYPNGYSDPELHVPVNTPVRVILESEDVIHSLFIPAFRVKKDDVPGRYNRLWFQATEPGEYDIYCAAYCGTNHSTMRSRVIVHKSQADFDSWMAVANDPNRFPPVELGKRLYTTQGCSQCHSVDGSKVIGPSWQNLYGISQPMNDGSTVVIDDAFIHGFLPNPVARWPVGYQPVMPPYPQLKPAQVNGIIAYMKSISNHVPAEGSSSQSNPGGPATQPATVPTSAPVTGDEKK